MACPKDCSGHGQCRRLMDLFEGYISWDREKAMKCVCDPGYSGHACSKRLCPKGDDPVTRHDVPEIQQFGMNGVDYALLSASYGLQMSRSRAYA